MRLRCPHRAAALSFASLLVTLAAWIGCGSTPGVTASTTTSSTGTGTGTTTTSGTGGAAPDAGVPDASAGPMPAIFSVSDAGTLVAATALTGQAPFAVHVSALEDVPEPCTWQPADAGAPCNPEDDACAPDSKTPADVSQAIWTCMRKRDADYNAAMSAAYLGGGDVLDTRFAWDFGDTGAAFDTVEGYGAAHVYSTPGTYAVTLTVRTETGAVGTATVPVTVTASTRPVVTIASDADLAQLFTPPAAGSPGRKIVFSRGGTFHFKTQGDVIHLGSGDWVTSDGDASKPAPILETAYAGCTGCILKLFATVGQSHLLVEGVEIRVAAGSIRPFVAEPDGIDVVFRDVVFSDGSGFTGPSRAFTLSGRGQLLQNLGAPPSADGTWVSSGLTANFAFMGGKNLSLYGNHLYEASSDGNAEPGVRTCGPGVAFLSVVGNDIGGWWGKANDISIRSGHNVYIGQNRVTFGVFDLQTGCSPNTFAFPTTNVVVASNHLENDLFQVNSGVFGVAFRDNVVHRQDVSGAQYPLPVTISMEVSGGTDPWSTDRVEIAGNTFLFEPSVGKALWFEGGPALTRVDMVDNLFYAPFVGAALQAARPSPLPNPWDFLGAVAGNVFFLGTKESVVTMDNGGTSTGLSLDAWNQIPLAGAVVKDAAFDPSTVTLPALTSKQVLDNGIEPIEACRPATSAPYAASGVNLFDPSPDGHVDARGVDTDLTGTARPPAGQGGWTPGALQAK